MNFKTESKRFGQHTYSVTQLNAVTGRRALLRITKIAAPFFAAMANDDIEKAFESLTANLTEKDFDHFCDLFAGSTVVKGGQYAEDAEPQLDNLFAEHFADNYFEMVQWLQFALEVNFRSFFLGAKAKLEEQKAKRNTIASASPNTSTTGSGG